MLKKRTTADNQLQIIANCLDIPVSAFFEGTAPDSLSDATECLLLWYRLKTDAGRAAALDALRKALDDEGVCEAATAGRLAL